MKFSVLARRGEGGYRQYRIPALACTPNGKLIAIYDGRVDLDDLPGPIDLVMRTSDDNGETWSVQEVFRKGEGVQGFGDASVLIDPTVGEMGKIMVFAQESQLAGFFESGLGADENDPTLVQIALSESLDGGETWSHRRITHQLKDDRTEGIFVTSGTGGRLTHGTFTGRLLHGCVLRRGDELMGSIIYSDDHGDTWTLGALVPGGNESAVVGLQDGSLLLHSRATPYRICARSLDGGTTLSEIGPDLELPDPSDNGSLTVLSDGSVICTHNHDHEQRRNTVVKRSLDGGKTWPQAVLLSRGSSAYSTACELADGSIGVLFERAGYTEIVFARVTLDEFKQTHEVLSPRLDKDKMEFEVELRFIRPMRNALDVRTLAQSAKRWMPQVDMSVFTLSSRKEIGESGGSTSGDPIFTRDEYFQLLGPISPGLKVGDEVRCSARLQSYSPLTLRDVVIALPSSQMHTRAQMNPGEKIVDLDIRVLVTEEDVSRGRLIARFSWSAVVDDTNESIGGQRSIEIDTRTGSLTEDGR